MLRSRYLAHGLISEAPLLANAPAGRALHGALIYTVPSGFRTIVRDWEMVMGGTSPIDAVIMPYVNFGSGLDHFLTLWADSELKAGGFSEQTDIVLEPGWRLGISATSPDLYYFISGAELMIPTS